MITKKQTRFCQEYMTDLNGTQAAIRAGYSLKTANEQAARLLAKVSIQHKISELQEAIKKRNELTVDMVVNVFRKIAFTSIAHLHNTWISRKEFEELTEAQKASISEIKTRIRKFKDQDSEENIEIEEVQIKLHDKLKALESLGRYLGMFSKDNEFKINYDKLSEEDFNKIVEIILNKTENGKE